jgi:hypothetical protein
MEKKGVDGRDKPGHDGGENGATQQTMYTCPEHLLPAALDSAPVASSDKPVRTPPNPK